MSFRSFLFGWCFAMVGPALSADLGYELKPGWTKQSLAEYSQGCVEGLVQPARRDYFAAAAKAGNSNPRPFPEEELRASAAPMCRCLGRRMALSYSFVQTSQQPELATPFMQESFAGGQCAPEGLLGEIVKLQKQKKAR